MKLEAVFHTQPSFPTLARCVDLMDADKHSPEPHKKLSYVATGMFGFDVSKQWIHITFYFKLGGHLVELVQNTGLFKIQVKEDKDDYDLSEGFITGSLADYERFVRENCKEKSPLQLRAIGNFLYNFLKTYHGLLTEVETRLLPDRTFMVI